MNYRKFMIIKIFFVAVLLVSFFLILGILPSESAQIKAGYKAPNFTLYDVNGKKVNLSSFRNNKVVLLDFGASWCPACIKGISVINRINKDYKSKGLKIIGIDLKESQKKVSSLIKKYNISYTMVLDKDGRVTNTYNVRGIPFLVLIDKEGTIRWVGHWMGKDTIALLEDLLKR